MKVKFKKQVGNAKDGGHFEAGKNYDLSKERASLVIKKGVAEEVKQPKKSTQDKISKKTTKK
jgi:hypothetical protein